MSEPRCKEGWICERHPTEPWPHPLEPYGKSGECYGPGMPCEDPACEFRNGQRRPPLLEELVIALDAMLDLQGKRRHPLGQPDEGIATVAVEAASKARAALARAKALRPPTKLDVEMVIGRELRPHEFDRLRQVLLGSPGRVFDADAACDATTAVAALDNVVALLERIEAGVVMPRSHLPGKGPAEPIAYLPSTWTFTDGTIVQGARAIVAAAHALGLAALRAARAGIPLPVAAGAVDVGPEPACRYCAAGVPRYSAVVAPGVASWVHRGYLPPEPAGGPWPAGEAPCEARNVDPPLPDSPPHPEGAKQEPPHEKTEAPPAATDPQADPGSRCGGCGGPYRYDVAIPSPVWSRVVRAAGGSKFCASCVLERFVTAGVSFTAELYGEPVNRPEGVPTISVQVGQVPMDDTEGDRELRLRAAVAALIRFGHHSAGCASRPVGKWMHADDATCGCGLAHAIRVGTREAKPTTIFAIFPDGSVHVMAREVSLPPYTRCNLEAPLDARVLEVAGTVPRTCAACLEAS